MATGTREGSTIRVGANLYSIPNISDDADYVITAGNQTIGGTKTFSSTIGGSINGNAGTATTLQTTRTLWGQNFNGSANVTGNLTSVGNISGTGAITITAGGTNQNITLTPSGTGTVNATTFNATSTTNGGFQGIATDSATVPSFTWTGDLDTGMYQPATNSIGFTTGGTDRLQIGSTGNVGINNSTLESRLTINQNIAHDNSFNYSTAQLTTFDPNNNGGNIPNGTRDILYLVREGVGGEAFGNKVAFAIGRYENSGTNSRTQLDIKLNDGSFTTDYNVLSLRSNGQVNIGTGTTTPIINMEGSTSNMLLYNINGVAVPSFTTRSAGTKIVLYPNLTASQVDYALGIETNNMWFSVHDNTTTRGFKWYGGTTNIARLDGIGNFTVSGSITEGSDPLTSKYVQTGAVNQTIGGVKTFTNTIGGSINGNAGTATTLQTTRTLWGQNFDGSANVSGNMSGVGDISSNGQFLTTRANNAANGSGQIYLNGATGNRIDFNINGVAGPTFTTRSAGTKIVLWPNISATTGDFALGIENSTLWQSIPQNVASQFFKWYGGTTSIATLDGTGLFSTRNLFLENSSGEDRFRTIDENFTTGITRSWKRVAVVNNNNGMINIKGILGGHDFSSAGQGQCWLDLGFSLRGNFEGSATAFKVFGTASGRLGGGGTSGSADLVIVLNNTPTTATELYVYIERANYTQYQFTMQCSGNNALLEDGAWSTTNPSTVGTNTTPFRLSDYLNDLLGGGTFPTTITFNGTPENIIRLDDTSVSIGNTNSSFSQNVECVSIGYQSGSNNQSNNSVAIGSNAGNSDQGAYCVAIGSQAGQNLQGFLSVAIGNLAGQENQGAGSICMGDSAGQTNQLAYGIAIGSAAGSLNQQENAIAIGNNSGNSRQGTNAIAIGQNAGSIAQGQLSVAMGLSSGQNNQGNESVALGASAGRFTQGTYAVAIGRQAGEIVQRTGAISIGYLAGRNNQGSGAIAIGYLAGENTQEPNAIAIGVQAGQISQGTASIAIGFQAGLAPLSATQFGDASIAIGSQSGQTGQGTNAIAIGTTSGQGTQGQNAVSIGVSAGRNTQFNRAIAIGEQAGENSQGTQNIAIGFQAAQTNQRSDAVAIGTLAGNTNQNSGSVAIGRQAGQANQDWRSIAIGYQCGQSFQGKEAVAIGSGSGNQSQGLNCVAIGVNAGRFSQGARGVAIGEATAERNQGAGAFAFGFASGQSYQGIDAIALGYQAGLGTQGQNAMGIGRQAGFALQGSGAIALGTNAGRNTQASNAIALGIEAGQNSQRFQSLSIGFQAGQTGQGTESIAIGSQAGQTNQSQFAIAIGDLAGGTGQNQGCVAIGATAGQFGQGIGSIGIGSEAGRSQQNQSAVAIGNLAGSNTQGTNAVSVGVLAGSFIQSLNAVAVGSQAGQTQQGTNAVAIGVFAASTFQRDGAVAIGVFAGGNTQGTNAIAIGNNAGNASQGTNAIAIGINAGNISQGDTSIALGVSAGLERQGNFSIAMGFQAANNGQGINAIAIGREAGFTNQGATSIAIGQNAGITNQHANSIILNATGAALNSDGTSRLFIDPIRNALNTQILQYNSTTHEVTFNTGLNATNLTSGTVPDARITGTYSNFTHKCDGSNTVYTTPNTGSQSTAARTVYGLAEYRNSLAGPTGAIVFFSPNTTSSIMYQLEVAGFQYNPAQITRIIVQGYRTTGAWSVADKISFGEIDVDARWAVDPTGKNCLILGDVTTVWSYPFFSIVRAMFSHTGASDAICTGWTVGLVTDLTGYTNITAVLANSNLATNITGSSSTLTTTRTIWGQNFDGSANVTGNLTSVGNITGTGAITITAGGTNQNITLAPSGTGTVNATTFNATDITNGGFQGIAGDTATNPSYTWSGDLDTGMYRITTDQIGFSTGGTERLSIANTVISSSTAQITLTRANNATIGSGQIYLDGATGNRIDFNQNGIATPTFTTRSVGTKMVLFPSVGASAVDYAIGIASGTMWFSVPQNIATQVFRWFGGTTNIATLTGEGNLTISETCTASTFNATGTTNGGFQGIATDTATTPSFTWTSDLDTGIYRPSADNVAITTAGVNRLQISTALITSTLDITTSGQYRSTQANDATTGGGQIYLNGATGNRIDFNSNGAGNPTFTTRSVGTRIVLRPDLAAAAVDYAIGMNSGVMWFSVPTNVAGQVFRWFGGTTQVATLTGTGNLTISGTLAKGSGSFKIDHPLKPETHHLVHSFVEGPRADLIYRGHADLIKGESVVNIDLSAGMTEGTFVALCRDVQCFVQNESDWDAVKGKVIGNKLYIHCQNPTSSANISWLVIGERKDKHMYETDWTDENGRVIVEPTK